LPEGLVESALFGHEKGAFTGAIRRVEGAFERAHRGTLLLDEISEMRLDLQAKLLRVLQEQEFERVGGSAPIRVDVRVIATTNRDLGAESTAGRFREDLFYRLSVIPLIVPPLRDRRDDVPILAYRFAMRTAQEIGKQFLGITPEALELLQQYSWPGNVRELQHTVERAVILSPEPMLGAHSFDPHRSGLALPRGERGIMPAPGAANGASHAPDGQPKIVLHSLNVHEAERVLIQQALDATDQNRTRAAELLGMSVRTLRNKLNAPDDGADE
jgi:transcriptional regulator with GAF, ATPase, and Fis domain